MFERLSRREKILLIISVFVIILALYYFYVYIPYKTEINSLVSEKRMKENQLSHLVSVSRKLPDLRDRYNKLVDINVRKYSAKNVFDQLVKMADESNVQLNSYSPLKSKKETTINISLSGNYFSLIDFLNRLEKWDKQIKIWSFSFQPQQKLSLLKVEFKFRELPVVVNKLLNYNSSNINKLQQKLNNNNLNNIKFGFEQQEQDPFTSYIVDQNNNKSQKQNLKNEVQIQEESEPTSENKTQIKDFSQKEENNKEISIQEIKASLPFNLMGIIGNDKKRLAVIEVNNKSKIVKPGFELSGYKVESIENDKLVISFQDKLFTVKMRSGINGKAE